MVYDGCTISYRGGWVIPAEIGLIEARTLEPDAGNADVGKLFWTHRVPGAFFSRRGKRKERRK